MMRIGFLCLLVFLAPSFTFAADEWKAKLPAKDNVADYILDVSVSIAIENRELGSGTLVAVPVEGKTVNFIVTCAHVVAQLRTVEEVIDPKTGTRRQVARFKDCQISKEFREDGRKVGSTYIDCVVVKYDEKEDIALLRVRKKNYTSSSAVFYPGKEAPKIATELLHGGSLAGSLGAHSVTPGIIAQVGRVLDGVGKGKVFDQTTVTACPGSSGGGVFRREDGTYLGMLSIGVQVGTTFNFIIPIRRIHEWAKTANVEWVFDPTVKPPSELKLDDMRVEEVGAKFDAKPAEEVPKEPVRSMPPSRGFAPPKVEFLDRPQGVAATEM